MTKLVLLVDDNRQMRQALRMLFESEPGFEVAGEAEHGQEAIEKAVVLNPHLIVLDLEMPVMNGLQAAPALLKRVPEVVIIMFTLFADGTIENIARGIGIHAVVSKDKAHTLIPTAHTLLRRTRTDGHPATA